LTNTLASKTFDRLGQALKALVVVVHTPSLMLLLKQTSINTTSSPRGSQQRISTHINRAIACTPGCTEGFALQQRLLIPSTKEALMWPGEWRQRKAKANQIKMLSPSNAMAPIACLIITCMAARDNQ